jgi:hypothetical protein
MTTYTLEELSSILTPSNPKTYTKFGNVVARPAEIGEVVETIIDGQLETTNTVKEPGFVITGTEGEKYFVKANTFKTRYNHLHGDVYVPVGKVVAVKWTNPPSKFKASWGEDMIINPGDFLAATPDDTAHPYRIEAKAFSKTYKEV